MMSSVGGRVGMPFVGPYNTSKFALEGLSESLRRELIIYGVDVIVIAPGSHRHADLGEGRHRGRHALRQHALCRPAREGEELHGRDGPQGSQSPNRSARPF